MRPGAHDGGTYVVRMYSSRCIVRKEDAMRLQAYDGGKYGLRCILYLLSIPVFLILHLPCAKVTTGCGTLTM